MKQRNNHAKAKRKHAVLKLKAFWKRVFTKRAEKQVAATRPKGRTIKGKAVLIAPHVSELYPKGDYKRLFATGINPHNQRQRRKLERQTGRRN